MTPKWKKRGLYLIFPVLLGSVISSVVATEWHGRIGKLSFKNSKPLNQQLDQFIQASSEQGSNGIKNLTAVDLISQLAQNPNSVPLLMFGFATHIAKSIFDGTLFAGTQHKNTIGKNFQAYLRVQKKQAEQSIKAKRNTEKRVKREWSSDDERYLSGLKDFILGQINIGNIGNYYEQTGHKLTTRKKFQNQRALTFIGFLLAQWIGKTHVGRFIHEVLPYSSSFQETTTELYKQKYKNVNLPDKPNFHFPDFSPSNIGKFQEAINVWAGGDGSWKDIFIGRNRTENLKNLKSRSALHWVSKDNTAQKNLALKLLTTQGNTGNGGGNGLTKTISFLWKSVKAFLRPSLQSSNLLNNDWQVEKDSVPTITNLWKDLKQDPLKLFRISGKENQSVEFLIHSPNPNAQDVSEKIIFWRDEKGFNILFPVSQVDINGKTRPNNNESSLDENFHKSKDKFVEEFKEYVKENFPYLLLKYYCHIKGECNGKKEKPESTCCCKDVIDNLIKIWELSAKLKELNENLRVWDLRSKNNKYLNTVDYSQESSSYLSKLGTVSANPPSYLSKVSHESEVKNLNSSIKKYLQKIEEYFKKELTTQLKPEQKNGEGSDKEHKYWTFTGEAQKQKTQDSECMKRYVAEFLLEKISTLDLLKKHLLLSISFEKITELIKNGTESKAQKPQATTSLQKLEEALKKSYNGFFNFQNGTGTSGGGGRTRREAKQTPSTNSSLISLLLQAIKDELVISNLGTISDSLLYKLSNSNGEKTQTDSSSHFETIKNWLTINALLGQPLRKTNTLENTQLRLLITALYLLEDSMKEYRDLLKSIIKNDFFGSYAFSLSWNKFCTFKEEENPIDPDKNQTSSSSPERGNGNKSFWAPIDSSAGQQQQNGQNREEWSPTKINPKSCIKNLDRFSIALFKKKAEGVQETSSDSTSNNSEMKLMGYKGSVSRGSQFLLPGNLYEKILDFLLKEGHITWKQIENQVDLIKSNSQFSNFIKQLTKVKSTIGQAFELPDYKQLKEDLDQSKKAEALEWLGLTQKKELLKKFIKQHLFSEADSSVTQLTQASQSAIAQTPALGKNEKKNFRGLMWDKESTTSQGETSNKTYIFNTQDANEGSALIYLIQYNHEDLKDSDSFKKFLTENLTPDMLIRDIVKKARDKGLQSKAINHYLMRGNWATGDKVFNLKSNDYYLKDQFSSIIL